MPSRCGSFSHEIRLSGMADGRPSSALTLGRTNTMIVNTPSTTNGLPQMPTAGRFLLFDLQDGTAVQCVTPGWTNYVDSTSTCRGQAPRSTQ